MPSSQSVVILAAGEGKRMGPGCSKVLRKLNGKPMIERIINAVIRLKNIEDIFVIANEKNYNDIVLLAPGCKVLLQGAERGTAKAVEPWSLYDDDPEEMALIISGDTPLLTTSMLQRFLDESATTGIVVFTPDDPKQYGRVILQNSKVSIKEFSDCNDEERQNRLCNAGIYNISRGLFKKYMKEINNHNVQHEYYLPDVINNMTEDVFVHHVHPDNQCRLNGVNTIQEMENIENILRVDITDITQDDFITGKYGELIHLTFGPIDQDRIHDYITWYTSNTVTSFVIRHPWLDKIVACITIWLDIKPFHDYRPAAHIEDLCVHPDWWGEGFATKLILHAIQFAQSKHSYKIILDCKDHLQCLYERLGFQRHGLQMSLYL